VTPFLGGLEQLVDLHRRQKVLAPLVGVGGFRLTLYFSPVVGIGAALKSACQIVLQM